MSARRIAATAIASLLVLAPAAWAAYPKRGTYIDTKLQVYLVTTKNAKALKSMQFPCQYQGADGSIVSGGGVQISRKAKISSSGSVSFSGKAAVYEGSSEKQVKNVSVTAKFSGGKAKGTLTVKDSACLPVEFSAKYYGVNPKG